MTTLTRERHCNIISKPKLDKTHAEYLRRIALAKDPTDGKAQP